MLDALTLDLVLDLVYGELVANLTAEEKEALDKTLETVSETPASREAKQIPVTKGDGTVVYVSPERWNRLMNNRRATRSLDPRKGR